jgi:hypothetical protein
MVLQVAFVVVVVVVLLDFSLLGISLKGKKFTPSVVGQRLHRSKDSGVTRYDVKAQHPP